MFFQQGAKLSLNVLIKDLAKQLSLDDIPELNSGIHQIQIDTVTLNIMTQGDGVLLYTTLSTEIKAKIEDLNTLLIQTWAHKDSQYECLSMDSDHSLYLSRKLPPSQQSHEAFQLAVEKFINTSEYLLEIISRQNSHSSVHSYAPINQQPHASIKQGL